ncbi:MAG: hypothetical protein D3918_08790 [Candidatus Electrothrix sp. AX2]|nr:hypothetical protein [Candidatus Electrothrix gigas]
MNKIVCDPKGVTLCLSCVTFASETKNQNCSKSTLHPLLLGLELRGLIQQLPGQQYVRVA